MTPAIDVVIVSYNTRADLGACLDSVLTHPPSGLGEIFVVDNASHDGSPDEAARRTDVTVVRLERNVGFAAANNIAIRRSMAEFVLLLNSDTLVGAGALDALVDRLRATHSVAAGPRLVDGRGRPEVSFGSMLSPWSEAGQLLRVRAARSESGLAARYVARLLARERHVDWVSGACLLVRRDAAIAAGLLDERYFMYEEDVDFCAALRRDGGRVLYTPRATLVHLRGRSIGAAGSPTSAVYDRSHVAFYEKHRPFWAPWLKATLAMRGRGIR